MSAMNNKSEAVNVKTSFFNETRFFSQLIHQLSAERNILGREQPPSFVLVVVVAVAAAVVGGGVVVGVVVV